MIKLWWHFSLFVFSFYIDLFPIAFKVVVKPPFPFILYSNVSFCSQFFASVLFSYYAPTFHFAFTRCFHFVFIIAILWHCLAYFFWVTSIFILFIMLMGFITYKIIICARFCHDILTPILFCYVYIVSLCISIVCIIELPLLLAMSIFLVHNASNCALPCLQCLHLCAILLPHHFVLFYKSSFLYIYFCSRLLCNVVKEWRSNGPLLMEWWIFAILPSSFLNG
jgi:hypothetical protein